MSLEGFSLTLAAVGGTTDSAHAFLRDLAIVLCVAAVTSVVFQRLRQPVVLGYLIAGVIVGPEVPPTLITDLGRIQTLSELGVVLLMFSLGLEFSVRRIFQLGPTAGIVCAVEVGGMLWLGFKGGTLLGWTTLESVYVGACLAISSTMIVSKVLQEGGMRPRARSLVLGVLVFEDLAAILLLVVLSTLGTGEGQVAWTTVGGEALRLVGFLAALLSVGLLIVPRTTRAVIALRRRETTLVFSIGLCFALALLALGAGYSVVLGAFLAGSLIAESGHARTIETLVMPVRDVFAAVFFVSVGMLIDPGLIAADLWTVLALSALVIAGKAWGVSLGGLLTGHGIRTSVRAGLGLGQIGEFSFIIAGLAQTALGAPGRRIAAVSVAVSSVTAFTTPFLVRAADPAAAWVDRNLPRPLQTFASLYTVWLEEFRAAPREGLWKDVRLPVSVIAIDALVLLGVVGASSVAHDDLVALLRERASLVPWVAELVVAALVVLACLPFAFGVFRAVRRLGATVALRVLPGPKQGLDLAAAPRRMLVTSLQVVLLLMVGLPLIAFSQPFVPGIPLGPLLGFAMIPAAVLLWRRANDLQGHIRAGALMVVEALVRQTRDEDSSALETAHGLLPGIGELVSLTIDPACAAVGRTLAEIDLRGATGATVIGLQRDDERIAIPDGKQALAAGDVLALSGSQDAIERACALLSTVAEEA